MEDKDLQDQLKGLFSDLVDIPPPKTNPKSPLRKQPSQTRRGDEVVYQPNKKTIQSNRQENIVRPKPLPVVVTPATVPPAKSGIHWRLLSVAVLITLVVLMFIMYANFVLAASTAIRKPDARPSAKHVA